MNRTAADQQLTDAELVPCFEANVSHAKELERQLLDADIPAALHAPPKKACCGSGGCGCGAKVQILVRAEDTEKVAQLFRSEWLEAVKAEGVLDGMKLVPMKVEGQLVEPEGEPPCPACGTAAPLVSGACSDCGLQLE